MVGRAAGKFWIFRDLERHFATNLTRHIRLWSKYLARGRMAAQLVVARWMGIGICVMTHTRLLEAQHAQEPQRGDKQGCLWPPGQL